MADRKRAALDRAVLQPARAFGAGEELVPGSDPRALALHEQLESGADRRQRCHRPVGEQSGDRRIAHDHEGSGVVDSAVAQACRGILQHPSLRERTRLLDAGAVEEERTGLAHERDIHSRLDLEIGGVLPRGEIVAERLELEGPHALFERCDRGLPTVEPVVQRREPMERFVAGGGEEAHVHADEIVTLAERGHPERNDLADVSLRPEATAGHGWRRQQLRHASGVRAVI